MRHLIVTLSLLLSSVVAIAGDVDGKWTGTVNTPQGAMPLIFMMKADGPKLTGTLQVADFPAVPLKEGKIDGDKVVFGAELEFGANVIPLAFSGAQAGDEMKLALEAMGNSSEIVLKKEK